MLRIIKHFLIGCAIYVLSLIAVAISLALGVFASWGTGDEQALESSAQIGMIIFTAIAALVFWRLQRKTQPPAYYTPWIIGSAAYVVLSLFSLFVDLPLLARIVGAVALASPMVGLVYYLMRHLFRPS